MLNLFHTSKDQERKLYLGYFIKNIINIYLHSDVSEPISFNNGMMLGTATLFTLQFDASLNDPGSHSRSQDDEKAGTCAIILLYSC